MSGTPEAIGEASGEIGDAENEGRTECIAKREGQTVAPTVIDMMDDVGTCNVFQKRVENLDSWLSKAAILAWK